MTPRAGLLAALMLAVGAAGTLGAAAGSTGAEVMRARLGARATALGGAYTALGQDLEAAPYNPAGLAGLKRDDAMFTHFGGAASVDWEQFGYAHPFSFGALGLTGLIRHMPDINNSGAVDDPVASNDMLFGLTYAQRADYFLPDLFTGGYLAQSQAGLTVKYLRSHLGNYQASTFAVDLGLRLPLGEHTALGVSALNLGAPLRYIDVSDPLPAAAAVGLAHTLVLGAGLRADLSGDAELPADGGVRARAGLELGLLNMLRLRAGYRWEGEGSLQGFTAGAGIQLDQESLLFKFDYAFKPLYYRGLDSFEAQHLFGIGIGF